MPKFLIEVPHEPEIVACAKVVRVFLQTASHFLSNAEWGCMDGCHSAWIIIDVDSKEEARNVVPVAFRRDARITMLNKFTMKEIDDILKHHSSLAEPGPH